MSLPSSGTITMGMIKDELKEYGAISLDDNDCRRLAGKPSGTIKMSDFYGKSNRPEFDITVNMFIKLYDYTDEEDPDVKVGILRDSPKPTEKIMGGTIGTFYYDSYGGYDSGEFYFTLINCTEFFPPANSIGEPVPVDIICYYPDGSSDRLEILEQDKNRKEIDFWEPMSISNCNLYKYAKNSRIDMNGRYVQIRIKTIY